jgi:hypothetical protein
LCPEKVQETGLEIGRSGSAKVRRQQRQAWEEGGAGRPFRWLRYTSISMMIAD